MLLDSKSTCFLDSIFIFCRRFAGMFLFPSCAIVKHFNVVRKNAMIAAKIDCKNLYLDLRIGLLELKQLVQDLSKIETSIKQKLWLKCSLEI